ncbi:amidohydrolase [Streptomyces shenzhenensis]|uniref:amidohydrolase n=1 Tax=Streptomyces shenzhenensis TaxID=943815 RepID=UPI003405CEB9
MTRKNSAAGLRGPADLVLVNGRITADDHGPGSAQAIAIRGDRIAAVGGDEEIRHLAGPHTVVADLGGRRVIPGLYDSHIHFVRAGRAWIDEARWDEARSVAEALEIIRTAARSRRPGEWITVLGGWHPFQFAEGRAPTRAELDDVAPHNPVYAQEIYTRATLNTQAMHICGVTGADAAPAGGVYETDEAGTPTGVVSGIPAFNHCLRFTMIDDVERETRSTRALVAELAALGLTGVVDMGGRSRMGVDAYRGLYELHRRGDLDMRVRLYTHVFGENEQNEFDNYMAYVRPGFGDDLLRVVGIGEIMSHSWYDADGLEDLVLSAEHRDQLRTMTLRAIDRGWAINIHAVGDSAIRQILDVWDTIGREQFAAARRMSFSHADFASEQTLKRIREFGFGITVQHWMSTGAADLAARLGVEQVSQQPKLRTMLDLGLPLGAGTDAMVAAPANPWQALHWLVTGINGGRGPSRTREQLLTREEALRAYTAGSAWIGLDETDVGVLRRGMKADLAVLSEDYFEVPDEHIPFITSELTLLNGYPSHEGAAFAGLRPAINA